MGKFNFETPENLQNQLSKIANLDGLAPKMINAATPAAVSAIKKRLTPHNKTQHLLDSVTAKKAKKTKNGGYIGSIKFEGYDKSHNPSKLYPNGTPNAVKAMGLEYGSSRQTAQPFLVTSIKDCEKEVIKTMQDVFNAEVKK